MEPHKKHSNHRENSGPHARVSIPPAGELTCSEGQVEDLLSEGESTEKESIPPRTEEKRSSRNIRPVNAPDRKPR